jgi:hypothetical protein
VKKRVEWIKWAKYPSLRRIKNVFYETLYAFLGVFSVPHAFLGVFSVPHAFLGVKSVLHDISYRISVQIQKFYLILFKFIS